jgi:hypothetical protein
VVYKNQNLILAHFSVRQGPTSGGCCLCLSGLARWHSLSRPAPSAAAQPGSYRIDPKSRNHCQQDREQTITVRMGVRQVRHEERKPDFLQPQYGPGLADHRSVPAGINLHVV